MREWEEEAIDIHVCVVFFCVGGAETGKRATF